MIFVFIHFFHRLNDSRVAHELVDRYIEQMKDNIKAEDANFDAADTVDAKKRTLLTIAEGADANSRLSKAVRELILFFGLYKIDRKAPPAHKSKTCVMLHSHSSKAVRLGRSCHSGSH